MTIGTNNDATAIAAVITRMGIYAQITDERHRQWAAWGPPGTQFKSDYAACTVLMEEVGEIAKASLERDRENLEVELVQTAAVCVAWLEQLAQEKEERRRAEQANAPRIAGGAA